MGQENKTTGLVDYKELETNILSSIREGKPLTGRDGALTSLIKRLLEASLEGEMESHLSNNEDEEKHVEEIYDHKISAAEIDSITLQGNVQKVCQTEKK